MHATQAYNGIPTPFRGLQQVWTDVFILEIQRAVMDDDVSTIGTAETQSDPFKRLGDVFVGVFLVDDLGIGAVGKDARQVVDG